MEFIVAAIDVVLHLERYLDAWSLQYGIWMYAILFTVIFAETGLVVTPFLPGDSLLFAVGALAARGTLSLPIILVSLSVAAIAGDTLNYAVGRYLGHVVTRRFSRVVKREYLQKTHEFYEKYGNKTIVLARFVPIVRTLAPFVAGIAEMRYRDFAIFNVVGGIFWISSMTLAGYAFGNLEVIRKHFSLVVIGIVLLSVMPMVIEYLRQRRKTKAAA
ncbi:DedA family protein [Turneriella parva]|uniref:SNARE associated protein n=1 Tax=Turneriella parva (strain ATCC BAA-1111 / DSM 21527 / NCTC 11395 / H) TaxID=869212 RepID=I4B741_TURPD|nr:DedA family protein [Turneriella parva]AFM13098.1 SNARE associated protein [Turneriella parva DSM 21527]